MSGTVKTASGDYTVREKKDGFWVYLPGTESFPVAGGFSNFATAEDFAKRHGQEQFSLSENAA